MVAGLIATLLAPVTGGLFGLAYGTAIRIGYEQIYPALFPKRGPQGLTSGKKEVIQGLVQMYDIIGGKGAHEFGINIGIQNAINNIGTEVFNNPQLNTAISIEAGISGIGVSGASGAQVFTKIPDTTGGRADQLRALQDKQQELLQLQIDALNAEIQKQDIIKTSIPKPTGDTPHGQLETERLATLARARARELAQTKFQPSGASSTSTFFKPKTTFAQDQEALRIAKQKAENARYTAIFTPAKTKATQLLTAMQNSRNTIYKRLQFVQRQTHGGSQSNYYAWLKEVKRLKVLVATQDRLISLQKVRVARL